MAASVILFSAYQGWGKGVPSLLVGLLWVAMVLVGGWLLLQQMNPHLDGLYALIAGSTVLGALVLGLAFILRPPIRPERPV